MKLPPEFQFTQGSLQDFVDCQRRFQLRYVQNLRWPAIEMEPILETECYIQRGVFFHRMIQQHLLGVPAERLEALIKDPELENWWKNYLQQVGFENISKMQGRRYPELSLSAPIDGYRLTAKYDLIWISPSGKTIIYDWKTWRTRPLRGWLNDRLQTHVYPYPLVQAGAHLNQGVAIQPEDVEIVYWFANYPNQPETFIYSIVQYQSDQKYLRGLIERIHTLDENQVSLTTDERKCSYCVYRSLCDRGVQAGDMADFEGDWDAEEGLELSLIHI